MLAGARRKNGACFSGEQHVTARGAVELAVVFGNYVLGDVLAQGEDVAVGVDDALQAGVAFDALVASAPATRLLDLGQSAVEVGDVKAEPALAFLAGPAAVQRDGRVAPAKL